MYSARNPQFMCAVDVDTMASMADSPFAVRIGATSSTLPACTQVRQSEAFSVTGAVKVQAQVLDVLNRRRDLCPARDIPNRELRQRAAGIPVCKTSNLRVLL